MKMLTDRRGMSLVELVLVALLGALIVGALFQVLVTNQRTYAAQNAMVRDQQSLRAGIDVLFGELREISPADGDLVTMGSDALRVRSSRSVALVCSVLSAGMNFTVQAKVLGRYLRGDSARVYFENDPSFVGDDVWRSTRVNVIDTTGLLNCPDGEPAQSVRLQGIRYGAPPDSMTTGALIRNFNHYGYGLRTWGGEPYLVRVDESGTEAPLVGPLAPNDGVSFRYLDIDENVTTNPTQVRQIEVTLRTLSDFIDQEGVPLQDSLSVRIYTRND